MKYFTLAWWQGLQSRTPPPDPFEDYAKHYDTLKNVPPALDELSRQRGVLHDARLLCLKLKPREGSLVLYLHADDAVGGALFLECRYIDVSSFESYSDPEHGLRGPHGYGDLGYDEIHSIGSRWEHRLLFSSGIELRIQFAGFSCLETTEPPKQR